MKKKNSNCSKNFNFVIEKLKEGNYHESNPDKIDFKDKNINFNENYYEKGYFDEADQNHFFKENSITGFNLFEDSEHIISKKSDNCENLTEEERESSKSKFFFIKIIIFFWSILQPNTSLARHFYI